MPTHQTFLGHTIFQTWEDLRIWEKLFNDFGLKTFLEFGSGYGGSSLYFGLQCRHRGIEFHTYDNQRNFDTSAGLCGLLDFPNRFHNVNIFGENESQTIGALINNCARPLGMFFDNGDKPREWRIYAPLARSGEILAVHDWGTEFASEHLNGLPVE